LSYLHEFAHITLARLLLARARRDSADDALREAIDLLERLHAAAEAGERTGSVIEILALLAPAHQLQGDLSAALAALTRALMLAAPEGYVRIFVDEGPDMAALLQVQSAKRKGHIDSLQPYRDTLLAAFQQRHDANAIGAQPVLRSALERSNALAEPLSERERAVLRLLRSELSGPEIARELFISLNTLRTHTKNIYAKLGVNNRRAAVRRAEELDLL
jgi:LuxR family maltose regulon positive regulatory protein